jgi:hypothetical protein
MTVSAKWFGQAIMQAFGSGVAGNAPNIDYLSDEIKVALFTSAHAPDQDADVFYDASNGMTEVTQAGNYTTGGVVLGTKTLDYTAGTNVIKFGAADASWASSTITARYAEIYDNTPASNKPLLGFVDFGADVVSTNGTFLIDWDAAGLLTITPA